MFTVEEDNKKQSDFILNILGGLEKDNDIFFELIG